MSTDDLQTVAQRQWIEGSDESNLGYYDYEDVDFTTPLHAECEPLVLRSAALSRIEALERERDEWRESCAQAAREVNALREMLRDAIRWHAVQHVFHVERAARDQVMLSAHWSAWVNGQHHTVTDAVDAYAAQNAGAKP